MEKRRSMFVMAVLVAILIVAGKFDMSHVRAQEAGLLEDDVILQEVDDDKLLNNAKKLLERFDLNTEEDEADEVTLDSVFQKLKDYSSQLGDGIYYGVISLSNQEMQLLREFAKFNMTDFDPNAVHTYTIPNAETIGDSNILKRDSHVWGLGYCKCDEGILYVHVNRQFVYYDSETGKLIAITNPMDFIDDNHGEYDNVLWDDGEDCNKDMPYKLHTTTTSCYIYYEKENGCIIQKMQFGEAIHTWDGSQIVNGSRIFDKPEIVAYGNNGKYFLVANHNLMYFRENEDKINLVSNNVDLENVVLPTFTCRTLYYSTLNELHTINIDTLEDNIIAEDLYSGPTVLKYADEKGVYYVIAYCSVDGNVRLVATVFEDYIQVE